VTLLGALLVAAPAQAADRCHPGGSRTVAETAAVHAFRLDARLYGCRRDGGRPQLVTTRRFWGPVDERGTDVAVTLSGCVDRSCATQLRVVRIRRRAANPLRVVFTTAAAAHVSKLVLGRHATLAWTECEPDPFHDFLCGADGDSVKSVWVSSRRTPKPVRLDRSRGVGYRSVRIDRGRVHWRNRGHRAAPIP
jgi:hypothetical protein